MLAPSRPGLRSSLSALLLCAILGAIGRAPAAGQAMASRIGSRPYGLTTAGLAADGARVGSCLELEVRVEGAARPVSLTLTNPWPGMVFDPVHSSTPPFRRTLRWPVPEAVGERVDLVFRLTPDPIGGAGAAPAGGPSRDFVVAVPVVRDSGAMVRVGDVTGDGLDDVVAVARQADRNGLVNAGVAHLWVGSGTPGGPPTATFELSDPGPGDRLGNAADPGLQLVDLDADGVLDVLIAAQDTDFQGISNTGGVFAFFGGPSMSGLRHPDVTFRQPTPNPLDQLGSMPVLVQDVTGDGVPELIAGSTWADVDGVVDAGAFWVWETGSQLGSVSDPAPLLRLSVPGAVAGDRLGHSSGVGVQLVDLDGDGVSDIVIGARLADVGGIVNLGAIYVWQGSSDLPFQSGPSAVLDTIATNAPAPGDQVGFVSGQGIQFGDVTGDGRLDVVAGAQLANPNFVVDSGVIYVWEGVEDLENMPSAPRMELFAANAQPGDALGAGTGQTVQLVDVTGDGHLDVIAAAEEVDQGAGRIYVWQDLSFQVGAVPASCELVTGPGGERLGRVSGQGVFVVDVTGDAVLDLVAGSELADGLAWQDMGRIEIWDGTLPFDGGVRGPDRTLYAPDYGTTGGDRMGSVTGPGMQFFDVTGDGRLDILTGASSADVFGDADTGAVMVWEGGASIDAGPIAYLGWPYLAAGDQLGRGTGQGIRVHDLNEDGVLDLVLGAEYADVNQVADAGAFLVWAGGANIGAADPMLTLSAPDPHPGDRLGDVSGPAIQLADLTGDTIPDLVIGARRADPFGVVNAGAYFVWDGLQLPGNGSPTAASTLTTVGANAGDQLGFATVGMQIFDMTGDGILDLLLPAPFADESNVVNSGGLYFWTGASQIGLDPFPPPDASLHDPAAAPGDMLGG